jgi:hypothetical protein
MAASPSVGKAPKVDRVETVSVGMRHPVAASTLGVLIGLVMLLLFTGPAGAITDDEVELAERYAPILVTKDQGGPCDKEGEPYRPVSVDAVLGDPQVVLNGPDGEQITAPTAADLFGKGDGWYLDFPGDPLKPGCTYEQWLDEAAADFPTSAYAHVTSQPDRPGFLAVQYWFYWPFNDWNNKHESDWEMIQIVFPADTAAEALTVEPIEVGYSQHTGAERADWNADKLSREGDRPVVFAGARSHANYFESSRFLGHGASEGFGCDDTRGPSTTTDVEVIMVPTEATGADDPFAWLAFDGQWGQVESGPNNGPRGASSKPRWTEPISWVDDAWRDNSVKVPSVGGDGTLSATGFFCSAVARGSGVYNQFLRTPWIVISTIVALLVGGIWLSRQTRWRPGIPLPIAQPRPAGQIYSSALRIYRAYWPLFLGIGALFIVAGAFGVVIQRLVSWLTPVGALLEVTSGDALITAVTALLFGSVSTIIGATFVTAASAEALDRIDAGERPDAMTALKGLRPVAWPLVRAVGRLVLMTALLTITVIGIPFAILYLIRRSLMVQAIVIEERAGRDGHERSNSLVRGNAPKVVGVAAVTNVALAIIGPLLGVIVLLIWSPALVVVNLVSALVYVLLVPFAGIALALLFYDLRSRQDAAPSDGLEVAT